MKPLRNYLTRADWTVILLLAVVGLLGLALLWLAPPGRRIVVTDGERLLYQARLDQAGLVDIDGPLGTSRLRLDPDGARIVQAPCPLKICMQMGPVRRQGELIACVPNRILVQVEGGPREASRHDLISR